MITTKLFIFLKIRAIIFFEQIFSTSCLIELLYFLFFPILDTPCGGLPVLCYNGIEIAQSMAVFRFLANEYGLAGKTNLERARADMIADCVGDLLASVFAIFSAPEDKKAELQKKLETVTVPAGMELLEKLLKQNGSKFFVGNCVSLVL